MGGATFALLLLVLTSAPDEKAPHRVLGRIDFSYSLEETVARAQENGKPIFAYFTYET